KILVLTEICENLDYFYHDIIMVRLGQYYCYILCDKSLFLWFHPKEEKLTLVFGFSLKGAQTFKFKILKDYLHPSFIEASKLIHGSDIPMQKITVELREKIKNSKPVELK